MDQNQNPVNQQQVELSPQNPISNQPASNNPPPEQVTNNKGKKIAIILVAAVLVVLLLGGLWFLLFARTSDQSVTTTTYFSPEPTSSPSSTPSDLTETEATMDASLKQLETDQKAIEDAVNDNPDSLDSI